MILLEHFIRGLNDYIGADVRVLEPKSMEVAVEKARLIEEKLSLALRGSIGALTISALASGLVVRGSQS